MERKIKTAIAGYGLSGRYFHAPFLASNPGYEVSAVLERNREDSRRDFPHAEIIRSIDELVKMDDIELVVITTPNDTHVPYALKCLEAGKHVLIEKPFTAKASEADILIECARKNGRILTVYQNRRFDGDFLTVRKIIEGGLLGRINEFESTIGRYRKESPFRSWKANKGPASGILYDLGPHLVDQAFELFGLPSSIWANLNHDHAGTGLDDGFTMFLEYENLRVILRAGTMIRTAGPRFAIHGENGSFVKYGFDVQEEKLRAGISPDRPDWAKEDESAYGILHTELNGVEFKGKVPTVPGNYHLFYDNLAEAVKNGSEISVRPEQAKNVIAAIEAAHKSAVEKKTVSFP